VKAIELLRQNVEVNRNGERYWREQATRADSCAAEATTHERIITALDAAQECVAGAKGACGKFNPHVDCGMYISRGMTCPNCPYDMVKGLDDALTALEQE
jgi:hypothetical protein